MAFAVGLTPVSRDAFVSAGGGYLSAPAKAAPLFTRIGSQIGAAATGQGYQASQIAQAATLASPTAIQRPVALIPAKTSPTNVTAAALAAQQQRDINAARAAADTSRVTPPAMVLDKTAVDMQRMGQTVMPGESQLPTYNQPQSSFQQTYQAGPMPGYQTVPTDAGAMYETPTGTEGTVPITSASSPLDELSQQVTAVLKQLRDKVASGGELTVSEKEFVSFMAQAIGQ